jgi:3D-(3,5/4)-trihydroxycyclohexane-1,2-dione acylhydrolase (decyclizing)
VAQLADAAAALTRAKAPLIVAGGSVHYGLAGDTLADFAGRHGVPVAETQAGKGALTWDHPCAVGAIGVTGGSAANALAAEADAVLAIGTRLSDFTTASRTLFRNPDLRLIQLNVAAYDAVKHSALPLVADAQAGLEALDQAVAGWRTPSVWIAKAHRLTAEWNDAVMQATASSNTPVPSDAQVVGAVNRAAAPSDIVVCAAGGLPGELHKLWRCR